MFGADGASPDCQPSDSSACVRRPVPAQADAQADMPSVTACRPRPASHRCTGVLELGEKPRRDLALVVNRTPRRRLAHRGTAARRSQPPRCSPERRLHCVRTHVRGRAWAAAFEYSGVGMQDASRARRGRPNEAKLATEKTDTERRAHGSIERRPGQRPAPAAGAEPPWSSRNVSSESRATSREKRYLARQDWPHLRGSRCESRC